VSRCFDRITRPEQLPAHHPAPSATGHLAEGVLTQSAVLGRVNELTDPRDVVLVTAVQERVNLIVILVQNSGFHSIGSLSGALGS
jgi:TPP-dependent trihydroxycyclohexane-1,2-dione (THcHDO) dehydratase